MSDQNSPTSASSGTPKASKILSVSVISLLEMDQTTLRLFELWLDDVPVREAALHWRACLSPADFKLLKTLNRRQNKDHRIDDMIVEHAFTEFAVLGHHLSRPSSFASRSFAIQASPALLNQLILRYYALDEVICRSLIGRKLKTRSKSARRGPDDASQHAHQLQQRVVANVQQVYEFYLASLTESKYNDVPLIARFSAHFMFPERLSAQYTRLLFLILHRFDLSKKRLAFLRMSHLDFLAHQMLVHWCHPGTIQIDRELLEALKKKPTRGEIPFPRQASQKKPVPEALIKALIRIGGSLTNPREFEDFFEDVHEKVVEPLIKDDFSYVDLLEFFGLDGDSFAPSPLPWVRYFEVAAHTLALMIRTQDSPSSA